MGSHEENKAAGLPAAMLRQGRGRNMTSTIDTATREFTERLLAWFEVHGRKNFAVAAESDALSRVGVGGHAATDASRDRDSVFRALHGAISHGRGVGGRAGR